MIRPILFPAVLFLLNIFVESDKIPLQKIPGSFLFMEKQ